MTSEYRHDGPYRRPAKGDLAYRVLKYPGWCNEEDPGGEWLGDVAMEMALPDIDWKGFSETLIEKYGGIEAVKEVWFKQYAETLARLDRGPENKE